MASSSELKDFLASEVTRFSLCFVPSQKECSVAPAAFEQIRDSECAFVPVIDGKKHILPRENAICTNPGLKLFKPLNYKTFLA